MMKKGEDLAIGDEIVVRVTHRAPIHRTVETVSRVESRNYNAGFFVCVFVRPPGSMGHYTYFDADEEVEVCS